MQNASVAGASPKSYPSWCHIEDAQQNLSPSGEGTPIASSEPNLSGIWSAQPLLTPPQEPVCAKVSTGDGSGPNGNIARTMFEYAVGQYTAAMNPPEPVHPDSCVLSTVSLAPMKGQVSIYVPVPVHSTGSPSC